MCAMCFVLQTARRKPLPEDQPLVHQADPAARGRTLRTYPDSVMAQCLPSAQELRDAVAGAQALFAAEPTLLELSLPLIVVGDLHGSFADLQAVRSLPFQPGSAAHGVQRFLFLGNYVDWGHFSIPVLFQLLKLKLASRNNVGSGACGMLIQHEPDDHIPLAEKYLATRSQTQKLTIDAFLQVFMLRGNHETLAVNSGRTLGQHSLVHDLRLAYPKEWRDLFKVINVMFDHLPLAALVDKRVLCLHGSLPDKLHKLEEIRQVGALVF